MKYKNMKNILKTMGLAALVALAVVSCKKDDVVPPPDGDAKESFGKAYKTPLVFTVSMDNGDLVTITELNEIEIKGIKTDDRLLINYTELSSKTGAGGKREVNARLNYFYIVESLEPVLSTETTEDYLGSDRINVKEAWITSGRFLNLNYQIGRQSPYAEHRISLVVDEAASDENTLVLSLRHNALEDAPITMEFRRLSFDIGSLLPAGKDKIDIKLSWHTYQQGKKERDSYIRRDTDNVVYSEKK